MKKTFKYFLLIQILFLSNFAKADEGMWIPMLLKKYNIKDMQRKGFKLTAEDIYSINKASMKDAVMIFGRGCTGEFVSSKGLLFTNHHCGFGAIQSHSSLEHDYLTDGFWAKNKSQELATPGLTVTMLIRMEDVTAKVLKTVTDDMSEQERDQIIKANINEIIKQSTKNTKYTAKIKPFFQGNQYFMFIEEVFKDVRLVGAPPSAIGKFGGDTDNWMWPRHTGDFSVFRVYANKDNKPAEYSEDNVPYQPKKHFKVSIKGIKKGDFTMVFGYPGHTEEYIPSYAVDFIQNELNPRQINIRQNIIDILSVDMNADPKVRIQYASKYAGIANGWKKWQGENRGLRRLRTVEQKRKYEKNIARWIKKNKTNRAKYGDVLPEYAKVYSEMKPYKLAETYFFECIWRLESVQMASQMSAFLKKGKAVTSDDKKQFEKHIANFFKDYNLATDKKIFKKLLWLYVNNVEQKFIPEYLATVPAIKGMDIKKESTIEKFAKYYYDNSILVNKAKLNAFVAGYNGDDAKVKSDPVYLLYRGFLNNYLQNMHTKIMEFDNTISLLNRKYMKAQMEYEKNRVFYPDANFTLRVTYGQVDDYNPRDGVFYRHYTTLKGIMEKDNPNIYDYKVPAKLKELYRKKDYGRYGENGEMHVAFTASNHTSGGNSGSPIINGNGELIGINFDRNWEGTMSDIQYDATQLRNISVDIRYVLFLIDKYAGAGYLIDEMDIVE